MFHGCTNMTFKAALIWKLFVGLMFLYVSWTYENVALHKIAWQQHLYGKNVFNASLAVDGRKTNLSIWGGECVSSGYGKTAEWRVDLKDVFSIHHIVIQYAYSEHIWDQDDVNTEYLLGFSLYISNTTNRDDGVLCFWDTNYTKATIPNPVNITCPYHGRYVIYYNNRTHPPFPDEYSYYAYNDLCEVEVYGCPYPGFFGHNCSTPCPQYCQEGRCHIIKGTCLGCQAGYRGNTCNNECEQNTYGLGCNQKCGDCSRGEQCNHVTGICLNGCGVGVQGEKCDSKCPKDRFGQDCGQNCSMHCMIPGDCDRFTGHCIGGCQAGWKNSQCDIECDSGMFGNHCNKSCGKCHNGEQCHHVNGSCLNGCRPGYHGATCTEECVFGLYGANCGGFCSPNCNTSGICDKVTGECNGGCQAGWSQPKCDAECPVGSYGYNCQENCSTNCIVSGICNRITGQCEGGCQAGWKESKCDKIETVTSTHGQKGGAIASFVTASILITSLLIIVAVLLFIGRRRCQLNPQHIETSDLERQGNRTESNAPISVTNNCQEYECSTLYTNVIQSHKEVTPKMACKNASNERYTEIPESSEVCNEIEHIANNSHIDIGMCYTYSENSHEILVNQIHNTIVEMKKCEDMGFKREFSSLSNGQIFPCNVGKRQENLSKNRYKTTLPYDHSRVILNGNNECSEYINASYITDTNREISYIATQGPTEDTVSDFWRMVWQKNITQVVMLTNLVEGGKIKCFQYWPDYSKIELYDSVTIENVSEKHYAFYITRKFVLSQNQMSRDVMQYHYTMWPDHGTPEPLNLAVFHNHVLRTRSDENKTPMAVHCSAGIGRTGTFIAFDALYKEGKQTGKINVMKYVESMRSCRMDMVQTYVQYMTIVIALNEHFKASLQTQNIPNFKDRLKSATCSLQKQSYIKREFEILLHIRPEYTTDDFLGGNQHANKKDVVLPLERYILYLTLPFANRGSYINAINVSSFRQNNAFIVTHHPPTEDVVDFLRLLVDHKSHTVICMDQLFQNESLKSWLPGSSSDKMLAPFCVQRVAEMETDIVATNIRILKEEDCPHAVSIVEPRNMQGLDDIQMDTSSLLSLVSYAMNASTDGPITVVSKDGASLCGAFCAVYNSIQQINMDDSVDVFTTVRQLQTRRPEFCSTLDEYMLVYRALHDYIGTLSEKIYENL